MDTGPYGFASIAEIESIYGFGTYVVDIQPNTGSLQTALLSLDLVATPPPAGVGDLLSPAHGATDVPIDPTAQ